MSFMAVVCFLKVVWPWNVVGVPCLLKAQGVEGEISPYVRGGGLRAIPQEHFQRAQK